VFGLSRSSRPQPPAAGDATPSDPARAARPAAPFGQTPQTAPSSAAAAVIPPAEAAAADLDLDSPASPGEGPLDFTAFEQEWREAGSLSETSYRRLADAGIPREIVDAYVAGQQAMGDALRAELLATIGGEEAFEAMADWAGRTLSPADLQAYDAALQGTPEQAKLALRGLHAAWVESTGRRPRLVGGRGGTGDDVAFSSAQQVAEAIRDPRYKRDPAYRAEIQARLARSNVFGRR
jgi:hypothetical protein